MSRERKGGLAALLHQNTIEEPSVIVPNIPAVPEPKEKQNAANGKVKSIDEEEQITIRAPKRYLKIIDRYRLAMIFKTGNVNYTKKEAFTDIMKFFEANSPLPLPEE
jgi:hypothetical protein